MIQATFMWFNEKASLKLAELEIVEVSACVLYESR